MICGTIDRTLKSKATSEMKIKFYKINEILNKNKKFLSQRIENEDIRTELNILSVNEKIEQNAQNWEKHINRINGGRLVQRVARY